MKTPKILLMDFYLALLSLPFNDPFRILNQRLYIEVRDTLAAQVDCDKETLQAMFERMVSEDQHET